MNESFQKIGLGSAQFGMPYGISNSHGKTPIEEVTKILELAKEKGIRLLDTASAYGNAEKVLGKHDLSSFKIVSKFMPPGKRKTITDQLSKSLGDLGVTSLYGYLAHRPKNLAENLHQWEELNQLKEQGFIQNIGFSLNEVSELEQLLAKGTIPNIIQVPFNYFDRRFEDAMISLKEDGCEIHSRSVFLQGLFFTNIQELGPYFNEVLPILEHLQSSVENLPAALLNFVLNQPFIDRVIVGVENSRQFTQNLENNAMFDSLPKLHQKISESILIPSNWPK